MTTAERIFAEVRSLPEEQARAVLNYVVFLKSRIAADRSARFVCYLHFIDPDGRETAASGAVEGTIAPIDRGAAGFSFDPIFVYPATQRTFAEMSETEKNAVSHRRRAVSALLHELRRAGGTMRG